MDDCCIVGEFTSKLIAIEEDEYYDLGCDMYFENGVYFYRMENGSIKEV